VRGCSEIFSGESQSREKIHRLGRLDARTGRCLFEPVEQVSAWIEKTRRFWSARLDALDELLMSEDDAAAQEPNEKGKWK
jgi:hypothetical protein